MISFIDDHRATYGVEPICRVLPIAPATYHAMRHGGVFDANFGVYGVRKIWRQPCWRHGDNTGRFASPEDPRTICVHQWLCWRKEGDTFEMHVTSGR
jgi:hypothetical protein